MGLDRFVKALKGGDMDADDLNKGGKKLSSLSLGGPKKKMVEKGCGPKTMKGSKVKKSDLAARLWPDKTVPWQEVAKIDKALVLEAMPDAVFEEPPKAEGFSQALKANPYHDAEGYFTTKEKAVNEIPVGETKELKGKERDEALKEFGLKKPVPASKVSVEGEDQYEYVHGKRPSGRGSWYFSKKRKIDFSKDKAEKDFYQSPSNTLYSDAKRKAREWAGESGAESVYLQT